MSESKNETLTEKIQMTEIKDFRVHNGKSLYFYKTEKYWKLRYDGNEITDVVSTRDRKNKNRGSYTHLHPSCMRLKSEDIDEIFFDEDGRNINVTNNICFRADRNNKYYGVTFNTDEKKLYEHRQYPCSYSSAICLH